MLTFYASRFVSSANLIALLATYFDKTLGISVGDIPSPTFYAEIISKLRTLRDQLQEINLLVSVKAIDRIIRRMEGGARLPDVAADIRELQSRMVDELELILLLRVGSESMTKYTNPLDGWETVIERFGCTFDIEEAGKCFATDRFTASVFHLMRVVESAVLKLQIFLKEEDLKAHFGSVVSKLENLHTKTSFGNVPDHLKPYRQFLIDILPQLHAVKDSWRNRFRTSIPRSSQQICLRKKWPPRFTSRHWPL